jgi:hypothetical protein
MVQVCPSAGYWAWANFIRVDRKQLTLEKQNCGRTSKPEEAAKSGQDHLKSAASDLKKAAGAKIENIRQAAGQKADEFRGAAQDKVLEYSGAAEKATSQARIGKHKAWLTFATIQPRRSWSLWVSAFCSAIFFENNSWNWILLKLLDLWNRHRWTAIQGWSLALFVT